MLDKDTPNLILQQSSSSYLTLSYDDVYFNKEELVTKKDDAIQAIYVTGVPNLGILRKSYIKYMKLLNLDPSPKAKQNPSKIMKDHGLYPDFKMGYGRESSVGVIDLDHEQKYCSLRDDSISMNDSFYDDENQMLLKNVMLDISRLALQIGNQLLRLIFLGEHQLKAIETSAKSRAIYYHNTGKRSVKGKKGEEILVPTKNQNNCDDGEQKKSNTTSNYFQNTWGTGQWHNDLGFLTALIKPFYIDRENNCEHSQINCLHGIDKERNIIDMEQNWEDDTLMYHIGELLEILTLGKYYAIPHSVLKKTTNIDRIQLATFITPQGKWRFPKSIFVTSEEQNRYLQERKEYQDMLRRKYGVKIPFLFEMLLLHKDKEGCTIDWNIYKSIALKSNFVPE